MGKWSQDGTMMYWYEQIDDIWLIMEMNLSSNKRQSILTLPVFRFEIPDKSNLHYQKIGTIKVHSRHFANSNSSTPKDRVAAAIRKLLFMGCTFRQHLLHVTILSRK